MLCKNCPLASVCSKIAIFRNPLHKVLPCHVLTLRLQSTHTSRLSNEVFYSCVPQGQRSNLRVLHLPYKNKHLFGVSNLNLGYSKIR